MDEEKRNEIIEEEKANADASKNASSAMKMKTYDGSESIEIPISLIVAALAIVISIIAFSRASKVKNEYETGADKMKQSIEDIRYQMESIALSAGDGNSIMMANTISNYDNYLRLLGSNTGYVALFAVKDIQGYHMTQEQGELLKNLGFDQTDILLEHEYHSFIGIVQDGKMVYQQVGGDEDITYSTHIAGVDVSLESATLNSGNIAQISVNGSDRSVNRRAFNIVVIDSEKGIVIDSVNFDLHVKEMTCTRIK